MIAPEQDVSPCANILDVQYVGDGFVVDASEFTVEYQGVVVDLEPQAFDLLVFMMDARDRLLTKAELLDGVWGDQFVGESALTTRIKQIRQALGDDGRSQRVIKTVHGRGYRFVAPVETIHSHQPADPAPPHAEPVPTGSPTVRHNIPAARNAIVGRTQLITDLIGAVGQSRLVTAVGLGGVGKTTVAQEVGRRMADDLPDGAWFVDLVTTQDGNDLDIATANAMGVRLESADRAELIERLAHRRALLVLDNCEHVADEAAELCAEILDGTQDIRILATSRVPLAVVGEHRVGVGPLPIIDPEGGALELLGAIAKRAGATIAEADRIAAIDLCDRLDGLPLALELVGARLATMSVHDAIARLDHLVDAQSRQRRPTRQASLAVVLDDAIAGLTPGEADLLAALALVNGPVGVTDIERLGIHRGVPDALDALETLVERSLAVAVSDGPREYVLLEMVRERARVHDRGPETSTEAHANWCLEAVGASLHDHFYDLDRASWVVSRLADLVAAVRVLESSGRHDDAARILGAGGLAMHFDDGARAGRWLETMQSNAAHLVDNRLLARLHCAGVMTSMGAHDHARMYQHGLDAVASADRTDDASLRALARVMRSWAGVVVDLDGALRDLDDAVQLARDAGDAETELIATGYKVLHLAMALEFDEAIELGLSAYDPAADGMNYPVRVATQGLICCLLTRDPAQALAIDDQVRTRMKIGAMWGMDLIRACLHANLGRAGVARDLADSVGTRLRHSGLSALPDILIIPASLAHAQGDTERASRYLGAIRHADKPTQSLMVSTAYRVLRSDIVPCDADALGGTTEEVWAEAQDWLCSLDGA